MDKKDIRSFTFEELKNEMEALGEKAFRAKQIYEWLHVKLVDSFDEMTNVSKSLRDKLNEHFWIPQMSVVRRRRKSPANPSPGFSDKSS